MRGDTKSGQRARHRRDFIYDGWNLVRELDMQETEPAVVREYVWGLDLSQSLQGAGGVGGLLAVRLAGESEATVSYATYDANGNVSEYIDAVSGNVAGHYEYDAFGNLTKKEGDNKNDFPHRFSTKYLDDEATLYYYGYRFYSPDLGRWLSRDPIGEEGSALESEETHSWQLGIYDYLFVGNSPSGQIDLLGLTWDFGMWRFSVAKSHPLRNEDVVSIRDTVTSILSKFDISIRVSGLRIHADSYKRRWTLLTMNLLDSFSLRNVDSVLKWLTGPLDLNGGNLPGEQQIVHLFRNRPRDGTGSSANGYTPGGQAWQADDRVTAFTDGLSNDDIAVVIVHELITHARLGLNHYFAMGEQWNSRGVTAFSPLTQEFPENKRKIDCSLLKYLQQNGANPRPDFIIRDE